MDRERRKSESERHFDERRVGAADGALAEADAGARNDELPVGVLGVASDLEEIASDGEAGSAEAVDDGALAVEPDHVVCQEIGRFARQPAALDVGLGGKDAEL